MLPSFASVAFGTFANAASVGANTVHVPLCSVFTRPDFCSSEASVLNWPAAIAVLTMFCAFAAAAGGSSTLSITWMIPFEAFTSGVTTLAPFRKTEPSCTLIATLAPFSVFAEVSLTTSLAGTLPGTTW